MNCSECNGLSVVLCMRGPHGVTLTRCTACDGTGRVHEDPFEEPTKPDHPAPTRKLLSGSVRYSETMQPDWWLVRTLASPIEAIAVDEYDIDGTPHIIYYHRSGFYAQQKERT